MSVWVASYGGSGTNWLNNALIPNVVDREWWRHGPCHAQAPIEDAPCTVAVYIYRHPYDAYASQLKRGLHRVNQRKLGHPGPPFAPARFAQAQVDQMSAWRSATPMPYPVILVRYEAIREHMKALKRALGFPLTLPFEPATSPPRAESVLPAFDDAVALWESMPDFEIRPARS